MIEDINAQAHGVIDTLNFSEAQIALSTLQTISQSGIGRGSFTSLLGIDIVAAADGKSHTRLEVKHHMLNRIGILHGGIAYSMADVTTAVAGLSLLESHQKIVTQDLHYRYHGMVKSGHVDAYGEVIHLGTRTVVVHCKIYRDDLLIGSADGTFALITTKDVEQAG